MNNEKPLCILTASDIFSVEEKLVVKALISLDLPVFLLKPSQSCLFEMDFWSSISGTSTIFNSQDSLLKINSSNILRVYVFHSNQVPKETMEYLIHHRLIGKPYPPSVFFCVDDWKTVEVSFDYNFPGYPLYENLPGSSCEQFFEDTYSDGNYCIAGWNLLKDLQFLRKDSKIDYLLNIQELYWEPSSAYPNVNGRLDTNNLRDWSSFTDFLISNINSTKSAER